MGKCRKTKHFENSTKGHFRMKRYDDIGKCLVKTIVLIGFSKRESVVNQIILGFDAENLIKHKNM